MAKTYVRGHFRNKPTKEDVEEEYIEEKPRRRGFNFGEDFDFGENFLF